MKKVAFIGGYDKTDLILYVARILTVLGNRVLFVDTTLTKKTKFILPKMGKAVNYITTFERIDVAIGFENLEAIEKPNNQYSDIIDAFEKGYAHEQIVTKRIYEIADIAHEEKEHATMSLLRWFIDEQVEEENNFSSLLKKVRRCKDNPAALYMMDDELATRVFTPPAN